MAFTAGKISSISTFSTSPLSIRPLTPSLIGNFASALMPVSLVNS